MALDQSVKVPMPEHGVVKRKMGDKTYVYYATAVYRNEKGQPTSDRVSIGRYDPDSGMLIPNRSYYEVYQKVAAPSPVASGIRSTGVYTAVTAICKQLGLDRLLDRYFPEHKELLLTAAQYMLSEGNVMYYLPDYTETHRTAKDEVVDDATVSRMFAELRSEDMLLFFREWMKVKKEHEYVAYDVTSFSSYGKDISTLEWGYNRDKEKLPQINMGMYYGEECRLPLYYRVYPGSITDKTHLKHMVNDSEFMGNQKTRFVMDRGFYSAENLQYLVEQGCRFIIALPGHLKYCSELIRTHGRELINHSECQLGKGLPYGKVYEVTDLGFRMRVHLYYSPEKALTDSRALYELLERQENELAGMEEPPDRKLHYDTYFYINRSKDGKLGYTRNHTAINEKLSECGFFLIGETDFTKNTAEILDMYRNRDVIEKSFDDLKNGLDMKRLRCHTTDTLQGKIFTAFLALILRSYLQNKLGAWMRQHSFPFRKVILELDKISCFRLTPNAKPTVTNPYSRVQREILELVGV